jgi:hypothetical protein
MKSFLIILLSIVSIGINAQVITGAARLDARYFSGYTNVVQCGAVGDGVTDNTQVIQKASDDLHNLGGGILFIPAGTFKISSLTIYNDVSLQGTGMQSSVLKSNSATTLINFKNTSLSNYQNNGVMHNIIRDIRLDGDSIGTIGISMKNIAVSAFYNIGISGFTQYGAYAKGVLIEGFYNCRFVYNSTAFYADSVRSPLQPMPVASNAVVFHNCTFSANNKWAIDYNNSQQITVQNCVIELNGTTADTTTGCIKFTGGNSWGYTNHIGLIVDNSWFEGNKGIGILLNNPAFNARNSFINSNITQNYTTYDLKIIGTSYINAVESLGGSLEKVVVHGALASYTNNGTFNSSMRLRSGGMQYERMTTTYITTSQRDAIVSPPRGMEIFNTTTSTKEFYNGTAWKTVTTN